MSFTNINDPAGVKALLEQLRSSQAWSESFCSPGPAPDPAPTPTPTPTTAVAHNHGSGGAVLETSHSALQSGFPSPPGPSSSGTSVSALLSQLSATGYNYTSTPVQSFHEEQNHRPTPSPIRPAIRRKQDVRSLTFQQSLPHLARLSEDVDFVASVTKLKRQQEDLEQQLWTERRALQRKQEEKVKVARTKAKMIGTGISQHEADTMSRAFEKELHQFDVERALPAWDACLSKQQAALEALDVPTMFPTTVEADRERQQRVMQVLEGITGGEEP